MLRGEIRLTDLDPARPSEANKRRPAVIVSNDRANATAARLGRGVVTIVPITSTVTKVFPFQVLRPADETGLRVESKAQAEQVRSVSVERMGHLLGRVPTHLMTQLDGALRLHLQSSSSDTAYPRLASGRAAASGKTCPEIRGRCRSRHRTPAAGTASRSLIPRAGDRELASKGTTASCEPGGGREGRKDKRSERD